MWFVDMTHPQVSSERSAHTDWSTLRSPWVEEVLRRPAALAAARFDWVKGQPRSGPPAYDGSQAFTLQTPDRRIVFITPYQDDFTLIWHD